MTLTPASLILTLLIACGDKDGGGDGSDSGTAAVDADSDGFTADVDCDDTDPEINPDAAETCDGIDNDCDGLIDDSDDNATGLTTYYADLDHDGYGDPASSEAACDAPTSYVEDATDCDDTDDEINPGATEVCDSADVDEDCDGGADDDDPEGAEGRTAGYPDLDGDGYGDASDEGLFCDPPGELVDDASDCDDTDPDVNPDADEICDGIDNDCDAATTEEDMASFWSPDGTWSDASPFLTIGTASAPRTVVLNDPGTLQVCEGTFYVSLDVQSDLTVSGAGSDLTVIDGGNTVPPMVVDTDGAVDVSGMALVSGLAVDNSETFDGSEGGGLFCGGGATFTGSDLLFRANAADAGGAIYADDCVMELTDSTISSNSATFGAGILAADASVYLNGGAVTSNTATAFAALHVFYDGSIDGLSVDMGVDDTDNSPYDVATYATLLTYSYDGVSDFACDEFGCDDDSGVPDTEVDCDNDRDDDLDSYIDCDDSDCAEAPVCTGGGDSGGGDSGGGDSGGGDSGGGDTGTGGDTGGGDSGGGDSGGPEGLPIEELAVGNLVITEIQKNPSAVTDSSGEWFEIYNRTPVAFDLEGLVVQDADSDSFTISGSLVIGARSYAVFSNNGDSSTNGGVDVDYEYSDLDLGNGTDELFLVVPTSDTGSSDLVIDGVEYSDATFPDDAGSSMTLSPDSLDATSNDDGANWCNASTSYGDGDLGTPGDANDTCATDTGT